MLRDRLSPTTVRRARGDGADRADRGEQHDRVADASALSSASQVSNLRRLSSSDLTSSRAQPIEYVEPDPAPQLADVVRAIIRSLRSSDPSGDPVTIDPESWSALDRQLQHHRIASLLSTALRRGAIVGSPEIAASARNHSRHVAMLRLGLAREATLAIGALSDAGIEVRVLKGLATGPLDYPEDAVRHTGDVDLLVRPTDFTRACDVLRALAETENKPDQPTELLVESTFTTSGGVELDLHHRLFRVAPADHDALFDHPTPIPGGLGLALSTEGRMLHAAGHLLLTPPGLRRISSLIDVAVIDSGDLDYEALRRLADESNIADVVEFARWLAHSIERGSASAPPPTRRFDVINRGHLRTDRSLWWETLGVLTTQDSFRDRLRYLTYQMRRTKTGNTSHQRRAERSSKQT